MKKIIKITFSIIILFAVSDLFADNTGCGLGTIIFKGQRGKFFEILAISTNYYSCTHLFAITSGTSGYSEDGIIGINLIEVFVADNMNNLAADIAKGDGEYLNALANLMKVDNDNKESFKTKLHQNFHRIYPSEGLTSKEVVANIMEIQNS